MAMFYAVVGHACGGLPALLAGAMSVQITASLQVGESAFGTAIALFYTASALISPFSGRLVERIGFGAGLSLAATTSGLCLVGIAAAARSWSTLAMFMVAAGLAHATSQVSTTLLIASEVPVARQGLAFGIRQSAVPAAMLFGGLAVPAVALTIGWRWAFVIASLMAAFVAVRFSRGSAPYVSGRERADSSDIGLAPLLCFAMTNLLGSAAVTALVVFFVGSSVSAGVSAGAAGLMLAAGSLVGFSMRVIAGIAGDRRVHGRMILVTAMLTIGCGGYLFFATESSSLVLPGLCLAFTGGFGWPGLFQLTIVSNYPSAPAFASGITQAGAYIGAALGPFVFGILVAAHSYRAAWVVTGAWSLGGAAVALFGRHLLKKEIAKRVT